MVRKDSFTKLFLKTEKIERNFIDRIDEIQQRRIGTEDVQIRPQTQRFINKSVSTDTFILSSPEHFHPQSVLDGTHVLWDGSTLTSEEVSKVVNLNNTFLEYFYHEDFIDSSLTTATVNTSSHQCTIGVGEQLVSKLIYKDKATTTFQINIKSSDNSKLQAFYSLDGTNWTEVVIGQSEDIPSTSTLYYRVSLVSSGDSFPLEFPYTFPSTEGVVVSGVEVLYS